MKTYQGGLIIRVVTDCGTSIIRRPSQWSITAKDFRQAINQIAAAAAKSNKRGGLETWVEETTGTDELANNEAMNRTFSDAYEYYLMR
jgi:hypothetical protein